jgi:hypothetical protein
MASVSGGDFSPGARGPSGTRSRTTATPCRPRVETVGFCFRADAIAGPEAVAASALRGTEQSARAAAFHRCRSGTASHRVPAGACPSSKASRARARFPTSAGIIRPGIPASPTADTPASDTAAAAPGAALGVRSRLRPERRPENPSWRRRKGRWHAARLDGCTSGNGHSRTWGPNLKRAAAIRRTRYRRFWGRGLPAPAPLEIVRQSQRVELGRRNWIATSAMMNGAGACPAWVAAPPVGGPGRPGVHPRDVQARARVRR